MIRFVMSFPAKSFLRRLLNDLQRHHWMNFPDCIAPLILKSLAWTVDGSTGLLTFTTKSLGRVKMVYSHEGLVTVQGVAVSEAAPARNVIVAIIKVGVRAIFTSRYHFLIVT